MDRRERKNDVKCPKTCTTLGYSICRNIDDAEEAEASEGVCYVGKASYFDQFTVPMKNCYFSGVEFRPRTWFMASLDGSIFDNCKMEEGVFKEGCLINNTQFINQCDLTGANFSSSSGDITNIDLANSVLTRAIFGKKTIKTLKIMKAIFDETDFNNVQVDEKSLGQFNNAVWGTIKYKDNKFSDYYSFAYQYLKGQEIEIENVENNQTYYSKNVVFNNDEFLNKSRCTFESCSFEFYQPSAYKVDFSDSTFENSIFVSVPYEGHDPPEKWPSFSRCDFSGSRFIDLELNWRIFEDSIQLSPGNFDENLLCENVLLRKDGKDIEGCNGSEFCRNCLFGKKPSFYQVVMQYFLIFVHWIRSLFDNLGLFYKKLSKIIMTKFTK